MAGINKSLVQN